MTQGRDVIEKDIPTSNFGFHTGVGGGEGRKRGGGGGRGGNKTHIPDFQFLRSKGNKPGEIKRQCHSPCRQVVAVEQPSTDHPSFPAPGTDHRASSN